MVIYCHNDSSRLRIEAVVTMIILYADMKSSKLCTQKLISTKNKVMNICIVFLSTIVLS